MVGEPVEDVSHIHRDLVEPRNAAHKAGSRLQSPVYRPEADEMAQKGPGIIGDVVEPWVTMMEQSSSYGKHIPRGTIRDRETQHLMVDYMECIAHVE